MPDPPADGLDDLLARIADGRESALAAIAGAADLAQLSAVEPTLFGRDAALGRIKRGLGKVATADRGKAGRVLGAAQQAVRQAHADARDRFAGAERRTRLAAERLDLTEALPARGRGRLHLVTQTTERLEDVFVGMGFTVSEGPQAETDWYNFEALNLPAAHPARSMWDTLYLDLGERTELGDGAGGEASSVVLRTHTSPVQIRVMTTQPPPVYTVCPGRVFRRDTADASHMPVFHQIEGLVVDRGISFADMAGTLEEFTSAYFGGATSSRLRPSYFPFTEPSAEFDITCVLCEGAGCRTCARTGWIELGGCGMVHPNVLSNCGIDPEEWTGFAFGFGIDRLALMRHGIDDLRDMYTNDVRFVGQFRGSTAVAAPPPPPPAAAEDGR
ncbi:MAG TPA: phenylalanine--tRNA ligase subunit alpha [Acidimicrobiaceae bacterium]|nr:phenylalanine--tRNA ligase subunit alpha [Acidimicrobiaceae bacterium]HCB37044.1 phenylalanine--tRNA ligase subunit alpha [Acidimicrobiaceae bacterium]